MNEHTPDYYLDTIASSFEQIRDRLREMDVSSPLSFRDQCAISATGPVMSYLSNIEIEQAAKLVGVSYEKYRPEIHWPMLCARIAFDHADAMEAERKKRSIKATAGK